MTPPGVLDSEICYRDLKDSMRVLKDEQESAQAVRKELRNFASLATTLDDLMRGELTRLDLGKLGMPPFKIPPFKEWSAVTALFLDLRDLTQHRWVVEQRMRAHKVFDASAVFGPLGPRLAIRWDHGELEPFDSGLTRKAQEDSDVPATDQASRLAFPVVQRARNFVLVPPTKDLEDKMAEIGTNDIAVLCGLCFAEVDRHYQEFLRLIANVDLSKMKPLASGGRRRRRRGRTRSTQTAPSRDRNDR